MTIDPLSIFFWAAAMFTFWLALERTPKSIWLWAATGLLIGLGFLCKYTNAFELISILLVLALVPRHRREFKRPGLYFLLGAFAICLVPPLVWNYQHTWITLSHLRSRGGLDQSFGIRPLEVLGFLGAHFLTFLAAAFSRAGLGRGGELAPGAATIQSPLSFLVRPAGLRVLLFAFLQ